MSKRKNVHLVMQAKGGIGKTFISWLLAQYYLDKYDKKVKLLDCDPSNQSFSNFKSLPGLSQVELLTKDENRTVLAGAYDNLFNVLVNAEYDVIVDSGSSAYIPLKAYLSKERADEIIYSADINLIIHAPIVGAELRSDTLTELGSMISEIYNAAFIVWINNGLKGKEVFNADEISPADDSQVIDSFESTDVFKKYHDRILGIVDLPILKNDTQAQTLNMILGNNLLFSDFDKLKTGFLLNGLELSIMHRHRRRIIQETFWKLMDQGLDGLDLLKEHPLPFRSRDVDDIVATRHHELNDKNRNREDTANNSHKKDA